MKVRLGYVAIALNLDKITSSSPVTYKRYVSQSSNEEKQALLDRVTKSNLDGLISILKYNIDHNIHFYRMTSKLIPLATHEDVLWDYSSVIKQQCDEVAHLIQKSGMRVDAHPDQFNVLNSVTPKVVQSTIQTLNHQMHLYELFKMDCKKMVLHVGGKAGGKEEAMKRFIHNFSQLPQNLKQALIIENDDKVFSAKDVLTLCQTLNIPMVLDVHHHHCYNEGEKLSDMLLEILNTWKSEVLPPKLHFSSPKEHAFDRRHSDFIQSDDFIAFIEEASVYNIDLDIMLEAKQKDLALFRLVDEIKQKRPHWEWIDQSTFVTN